MFINTNVSSQVTQSYLNKANNQLGKVMEQLSSGKRINSAADDAAGLSIATRMSSQISGMDVAKRNANDGISMLQTAEGALGSVSNILQRMRELAVQANNGTYSATDKDALQAEFSQLNDEISTIAKNTSFNGNTLIDTAAGKAFTLHVGQGSGDTLTVTLNSADTAAGALATAALNIKTDAAGAIGALDTALDKVSGERANLGSYMNRLEFTIDNLTTNSNNLSAARSRVEDADMARVASELTKQQVLTQSGIAMLAQANQAPQSVLSLLR